MVLPRFVEAALEGRPIEGHGDGRQSRCFCDVRDAVPALPRLLSDAENHGRVFNLGRADLVEIGDLAQIVKARLSSESEVSFIPYAEAFEEGFEDLWFGLSQDADFLIVDTPGRDDLFARHMAARANTLVTPMNDSFVDFDLIGQVDPETFKVRRLSFYSELIFDARKTRAKVDGVAIDWVVLRNRVQHHDARNKKRVGDALMELSRRVGFRVIPGLSERVIFRELFPSGLTLLDKGHLGDLGTSHLVARQELRGLIANLRLPGPGSDDAVPAAR